MSLTDTRIKAAKPAEKIYKIYDADGLYIEVPPSGSKRWRIKYRLDGKEKRISLGTYPEIGLRAARDRRDMARRLVAEGKDPSVAFRSGFPTVPKDEQGEFHGETLQSVAEEWFAKFEHSWKPSHARTIRIRLDKYVYDVLGSMPVQDITPPDVLKLLRVIEANNALETAKRTFMVCSQIFRYAVATARIKSDPCRDLKGALPPVVNRNYPAITEPKAVGMLMRSIDAYTGSGVVRAALQLLALTFVRPGALRLAQWGEFDFEKEEWLIPAERMKMKREHVVPLSRQAMVILTELRQVSGRGEILFPSVRVGKRHQPISESTLLVALRGMGYTKEQMVPHGFRSMASTLLNEQGWRPDVIERQLAHLDGNRIRAVYNRAEYITERRNMMQAWADYLDSLRASHP